MNKLTVSFICEGKELWINKGDSINVEPTCVSLINKDGSLVSSQQLRKIKHPDGRTRLSLQELSQVRMQHFKKEWDEVGKALCKM